MKNTFILIAILSFSFATLNAQSFEKPLQDKSRSEIIPEAPSANHTWVKGHYEYKAGKYYWVNGAYVSNAPDHTWVDGKWVKNEKTNQYTYEEGKWKQNAEVIVHNGIAYEPAVVTQLSVIEMDNSSLLSDASE